MALVAYQEPIIIEEAPSLPVGALVPYSSDVINYAPNPSNALVPYMTRSATPAVRYGSGALVPYNQAPPTMKGGQLVVAQPPKAPLNSQYAVVTHPGDAVVPPHPVAPKTLKKQQEAIARAQPTPIAPHRGTLPITSRLLKPYVEEAYFACFLSQSLNLGLPGEVIEMTSSTGQLSRVQIGSGGIDTATLSYRLYFDTTRVFVVFKGPNDIQYPLRDPELTPLAGGRLTANVHSGFYRALVPHMNNIIRQINANPRPRMVVTGFGNGGSLASVFYLALKAAGGHSASLGLYTFGAPCVAAPMTFTLTDAFKDEAWHYVLEGDPVPSLLGQRDANSLDQLLGSGNAMHKQGYNVAKLKAFAPFGSYFYMQRSGTLAEPRDLRDAQSMLSLHRRPFIKPQNHNVQLYLEALRNAVQGA